MILRIKYFVLTLLLAPLSFAQDSPNPAEWPTPTLRDLAGVWIGGEDPSEFLRVVFEADGTGIAVGTIDGENVNLMISDLTLGPLRVEAEFKAPPPSKSFHVIGSVYRSMMFLTLKDGEVNSKREFRLRRQDKLQLDIERTQKQAEEFKQNHH